MATLTRLTIVVTLVIIAGCGASPERGGASPSSSTAGGSSPAGSAAELPSLTSQATIDGFSGATSVVATSDAIWVLDHSAAAVVRIDPVTNKVAARLALGPGFANGLGLAGQRLWTFEQSTGEVIAVDPTSGKRVASAKLGQDGDLFWVGDEAAWLLTSGKLARIDGSTAKVTTLPFDTTCTADGVAAGAGFVWIASSSGSLCKIDERTGAVVARGSDLGNGQGIAIVDGRPWIAGVDGGLSIIDPASLAVSASAPAPAGGTFHGSTYSIGKPGGENSVVVGNADGMTGWVRYTGSTIGRVIKAGTTPSIVLYAGLPASTFASGVTDAFDSLWVANFDAGGTVQRYEVPTP